MPKLPDYSKLEKLLDYQFQNVELLKNALTHRSANSKNNERLEFLGDSILNFVIANELYKLYPQSTEGDLSRLRANLVDKVGLYEISKILKFGDYLILGSGELKSGGHRRNSILADTVEAIFGAVYLDSNFEKCQKLILFLYKDLIENIADASDLKDPKTKLQELLQSRKLAIPKYTVIEVTGQAHNQQFKVDCEIVQLDLKTQGQATNRRKAEQKAAEEIIALVQEQFTKKSK
jgi:ribonuclease III